MIPIVIFNLEKKIKQNLLKHTLSSKEKAHRIRQSFEAKGIGFLPFSKNGAFRENISPSLFGES